MRPRVVHPTAFIALMALVFVAGCSHVSGQARQKAGPVSHEQLRLAFRATFLASCVKGVPGKQGQTYCSCAEDRLERNFSDAQLAKLTPGDPKLRAVTHACAAKAGLKIRPGR